MSGGLREVLLVGRRRAGLPIVVTVAVVVGVVVVLGEVVVVLVSEMRGEISFRCRARKFRGPFDFTLELGVLPDFFRRDPHSPEELNSLNLPKTN